MKRAEGIDEEGGTHKGKMPKQPLRREPYGIPEGFPSCG